MSTLAPPDPFAVLALVLREVGDTVAEYAGADPRAAAIVAEAEHLQKTARALQSLTDMSPARARRGDVMRRWATFSKKVDGLLATARAFRRER